MNDPRSRKFNESKQIKFQLNSVTNLLDEKIPTHRSVNEIKLTNT